MFLFQEEGDTKVQQFDFTSIQQQNVLGFHIAMNHPLLMSIGQRLAHLKKYADHLCCWQERRRMLPHHGAQGSPAKIFQHEIVGAPSSPRFTCRWMKGWLRRLP